MTTTEQRVKSGLDLSRDFTAEEIQAMLDDQYDAVGVGMFLRVAASHLRLLEKTTPKPPRTLATRDTDDDEPCAACGKPLCIIHPDAEFELKWGHISRDDARHCIDTRSPGRWPVPKEV